MADQQTESVQQRALRLLKAIKAQTEDSGQPVFLAELVHDLKMGEAEAQAAFRYLADKRWIQTFNIPYTGRINAAGHDVMEAAERRSPAAEASTPSPPADLETLRDRDHAMEWDVFISHASEDKEEFVRPLAELLRQHGLRVWYDEFTLKVGDGLRRSIDRGLARSRYGVVVISPNFLRKEWPQKELDGLVAREVDGVRVILPVWHNISRDEVSRYSPTLADRYAASSAGGLDLVTKRLLEAIGEPQALSPPAAHETRGSDLVAIGPDIVCTGELRSIDRSVWAIHVADFVVGDFNGLVSFIDRFPNAARGDRYLLVNELGDGRVLTEAPAVAKAEKGYLLQCRVAPGFPRVQVQQLGSQWDLSADTNDLYLDKEGQIARVSGEAALLPHVRSCLSLLRGEAVFHRDFGTRFAEYFEAFGNSPWLQQLFKLEVIRQSAIPYHDDAMKREYTPLQCVNRVLSVEILAAAPENERLPIRVDLEVNGIGSWQNDFPIVMPSKATLEKICERQKNAIPLR